MSFENYLSFTVIIPEFPESSSKLQYGEGGKDGERERERERERETQIQIHVGGRIITEKLLTYL